jgi:hypothetical protein
MNETLAVMPAAFWIVIALLGGGLYWSVGNIPRGIGIPAATVIVTIAVWYVGDAIYNDYRDWHMMLFRKEILTKAWWQVAWFLATFLLLTPLMHNLINRPWLDRTSQALSMFRGGVQSPKFQRGLTITFCAVSGVWVCLVVGAVYRFQGKVLYYFFPYLGGYAGPWATIGVAGSGKDSFLALANYLQLMVGAIFGVVAALSTDARVRTLAALGVWLTWPYYIFDRTRKSILAIVAPGALAWVFLRLRAGMLMKTAALIAIFLLTSAWFGFVIAHRSDTMIMGAFMEEGFDLSKSSHEKHQGLNMYEELAWIVLLTSDGSYSPNWGQNYFANLVNPIPRSLWPGKPTIGLDYAIARGQGGAENVAGVYSTVSNGVIGQGLANFGLYLGPAFAAMLASLWACCLARLDLNGQKIGYLPLYGLGLILTFNMGRDITFLELYPFIFGYAICWWLNRQYGPRLPGGGPAPGSKQDFGRREHRYRTARVRSKPTAQAEPASPLKPGA